MSAANQGEGVRLWTVGHSNRSTEEFIRILRSADIQLLADVRRFPNSRSNPQFNQEALRSSLAGANIGYEPFPELGGRRRVQPDSPNDAWRNASFRGYADYMRTAEFKQGLSRLLRAAESQRVAIMCSEAVWWRCHRALIADQLKVMGHTVIHLLSATKQQEHPYSSAASVVDGELSYAAGPRSETDDG